MNSNLVGLSAAWLQCVLEVGIAEATNCVTDPQGKFKQDYGECIFGSLTEAEAITSDAIVRAWTNFAIYGYVFLPRGRCKPSFNKGEHTF